MPEAEPAVHDGCTIRLETPKPHYLADRNTAMKGRSIVYKSGADFPLGNLAEQILAALVGAPCAPEIQPVARQRNMKTDLIRTSLQVWESIGWRRRLDNGLAGRLGPENPIIHGEPRPLPTVVS